MKIYFLPTVWSDMTVIESGGKYAAVDTGDGPYHYEMITDLFERFGIRRLEFILLTHFHPDHYGCLKMLVEKYKVDRVYFKQFSGLTSTDGNGDPATNEYRAAELANCQALMDFCASHSTVVSTEGLRSIPFDQTVIHILYGGNVIREAFEDQKYDSFHKYVCNENQNSIMAYFTIHGRTVLLCGDVTDLILPHPAISMMNTRASAKITRQADIYKAPHHGLGIGSDAALGVYRPHYTVITNTEAFISERTDVAERLLKYNPDAEIFYTGNGGLIFNIAARGDITVSPL